MLLEQGVMLLEQGVLLHLAHKQVLQRLAWG